MKILLGSLCLAGALHPNLALAHPSEVGNLFHFLEHILLVGGVTLAGCVLYKALLKEKVGG